MENFVVFSPTPEEGEQVAQAVMASGYEVLGLDVAVEAEDLVRLVTHWHIRVIVARRDLEARVPELPVAVVVYDDAQALNAPDLALAILEAAKEEAPEAAALPPAATLFRTAVGFQGLKGGVGTTTLTCALARAGADLGQRVAVLDLAPTPDCALTLRARRNDGDSRLSVTEDGIVVLWAEGCGDSLKLWPTLREDFDLVLVDAGRLADRYLQPVVNRLVRQGTLFFLVYTPDSAGLLQGGAYAGYRLLLNRAPRPPSPEAIVLPEEADVTEQVNEGRFGREGTLYRAARELVGTVMQGGL